MDFYAFKVIMAEYCHITSVTYYLYLVWFYIRYATLAPIAFIFNQSFLIYCPNQSLPIVIAPARNQTIHSFHLPPTTLERLEIDPPPSRRHWCNPAHIESRIPSTPATERAIVLEGNISGPPLRQGMMICCQDRHIFLGEEIGRWPAREDYLLVIALNFESQSTFRLFIPVSQIDPLCVYDESPRSPLRTPVSLNEAVTFSRRYLHSPDSPLLSV